jgi:hypothetical protein
MKSLRGAAGLPLEWLHPSLFKREHELRAGDDLYGTLRWERTFGSLATAETADGRWTFKRSGFMTTEVTARPVGSEETVASLNPGWLGKGTLLAGSQAFHWTSISFWHASWGFSRPGGKPLVEFRPKFTLLRGSTDVEVDAAAWAMPELPLLVTMGWYMLKSMADDAANSMIAIS